MGWGQPHTPRPEQLTLEQDSDTIDGRFRAFHAANPAVYAELVRLARDLVAQGHRRLGIGMLWEVLRWQQMLTVDRGDSAYQLNDHYRSRYARLIMATEADLAGTFEVRNLRAA